MNVQLQGEGKNNCYTSTNQTLKYSQMLLLNDNHKVLIYYIHPFSLKATQCIPHVSSPFTHSEMTSVPLSHALSTCYSGSMSVSVHSLIQIPLLLSRDNATKKRQRISTVIILLVFFILFQLKQFLMFCHKYKERL